MHDAQAIADVFELGTADALSGPHASGHQGEIWRLASDTGIWAVKRSFGAAVEADVALPARFQEAAFSAGVATPELRRTRHGSVLATTAAGTLRVHRWVDMAEPDPGVDATAVGTIVGRIHTLPEIEEGDGAPRSRHGSAPRSKS